MILRQVWEFSRFSEGRVCGVPIVEGDVLIVEEYGSFTQYYHVDKAHQKRTSLEGMDCTTMDWLRVHGYVDRRF